MDGTQKDEEEICSQLAHNNTSVSRLVQHDKIPWYRKPNLRLLYLLMFPTCIAVEITNGFDDSILNALQSVSSWLKYYHYPRSASLGLLVSMSSLGGVVAVPLAPFLVDKLGRRRPILLAAVISISGAILQGFALNFAMFIIARFIIGFANIVCLVSASSLIGELSHPKERAIMGSFFAISYNVGAVVAAGATFGTYAMTTNWAWRIPSLLQIVPSLLQASFIWFMPESPRWLFSKGKKREAYDVLVRYHAEGNQDSELVKAEYIQIQQTLEAELKIAQMGLKVVLATPGMRKRIIITTFLGLFAQWCGIGLISHFLPLILDSIGIHNYRTKNIINLSRVSSNVVIGMIIAFTAPRYPRRRVYLTCSISLFIVFTAWTIASAEFSLTHSKISAQVVLALVFLFTPAFALAFGSLNYTFLVELFPFHVRAGGIAIYQWWFRCAGFFNQFVNPVGISAAGWKWYIIYCVWNAFQVAFIYLMFPETSGRSLEELAFLYEDDQEAFRRAGALPNTH